MGIFGRSRDKRVKTLTVQLDAAETKLAQAMIEVTHFHEDRDRLALELAQIRGCLAEVTVYEGLVDSSPVALMVSELVRDHEELEGRIDASMIYLAGLDSGPGSLSLVVATVRDEVIRLLQGGKRVPDDPSDLSI